MGNLELYMQRTIDLATNGLGHVSPNPLVGCVIIHDNKIIGEGFHSKYGGNHAEVEAINSVKDTRLLGDSTLFVNLEPCSHFGKTPPCMDLILKSGIKKVVVANKDPNPKVAGKGLEKLKEAGVEVVMGILEMHGSYLNRRFFKVHQTQRPYIILKWAQTADGFMARENYDSKWISNEQSRLLVHQYRAEEDAIMVGRGTAHHDNPKLTVRNWVGANPLRVVLDPTIALATHLNIFDGSTATVCYNHEKNHQQKNVDWVKIPKQGFLPGVLEDLNKRAIQSLLVEGGAKLLRSMIQENFWDEARVFVAPTRFEKGIEAPKLTEMHQEERAISGDSLKIYYNQRNG